MYIFNPEHDLCLANGDIHFVPPESALAFGRDCACLTRFMYGLDHSADYDEPLPESTTVLVASAGQYNATAHVASAGQYNATANVASTGQYNATAHEAAAGRHNAGCSWSATKKILPWGWNTVLRDRLLKQGCPPALLPSDEVLAAIRELSDRRVAMEALEHLNRKYTNYNQPGSSSSAHTPIFTAHNYRIAAGNLEEVEHFLMKERNVVLKAPLSGSGKGIRFVAGSLSHSDEGWCRNLIKKHGCVVVEKRFNPVLEFAMLFRCRGGKVEFVGYSLFYTRNGMYSGNILASDLWIENEIAEYISQQRLALAKEGLMEFLQEKIAGKYEGFIGVDQFVYLPYVIHEAAQTHECIKNETAEYCYNPVVEINLRMTMGLLAHNIYRLREHLHISTTESDPHVKITDGSHFFEICRAKKGSTEHYSYIIGPIRRD